MDPWLETFTFMTDFVAREEPTKVQISVAASVIDRILYKYNIDSRNELNGVPIDVSVIFDGYPPFKFHSKFRISGHFLIPVLCKDAKRLAYHLHVKRLRKVDGEFVEVSVEV